VSRSSSRRSACCWAADGRGLPPPTSRWKSALVVLMVLRCSSVRHAHGRLDDQFAHGGMLDTLTGLNLMYAEPRSLRQHRNHLPFTVLTLQSGLEGCRSDPRLEEAGAPRWVPGPHAHSGADIPAGAARHHDRRRAVLHPVHERIRHTLLLRRAAFSYRHPCCSGHSATTTTGHSPRRSPFILMATTLVLTAAVNPYGPAALSRLTTPLRYDASRQNPPG